MRNLTKSPHRFSASGPIGAIAFALTMLLVIPCAHAAYEPQSDVDITGGNVDGVNIGQTTPGDASFTQLQGRIGTLTANNATFTMVSVGTTSLDYATTADSVYVAGDLEVDGDVWLGDTVTDTLTIAGSLTQNSPLVITSTVTPQLTIAYNGSNDLDISVASDGTVTMNATGAGDEFSFTDNVGIGTTTPAQKLEVVGASVIADGTAVDPDTLASKVIAGGIADTGWVVNSAVGGKGTGAGDTWGIGHNSDNLYIGMGNGAADDGMTSRMMFKPAGDVFIGGLAASSAPRMVVLTAGNVGIGTTTPSQKLDLIGSLELEDTTTATTGVIYKGANQFMHNFHHPTGGGAVPIGRNTFVGESSGNFTSGSTAAASWQSSYNTALGAMSLDNLTLGSQNTALGYQTLGSTSTGNQNTATGYYSQLDNTTGSQNVASGALTLYENRSGSNNVAVGFEAGKGVAVSSDISNNTLIGYKSGFAILTGGDNNTFVGFQTGDSITTGSDNILIGYDVDSLSVTTSDHLNIGNTIYGDLSADNVGIGIATPTHTLTVAGTLTATDATFSTINNAQIGATTPAEATFTMVHVGTTSIDYATTADSLYVAGDFEVDGDVWLGDTVTDSLTIAGSLTQNSPLVITSTVAPQLTVAYNGSNDLDISVASDGSVTMNATGAGDEFSFTDNVGIGVTEPGALLDVNGEIRALNGNNIWLKSGGSLGVENSAGDNAVYILNYGTAGNSKMDIAGTLYAIEAGNVGIGVVAPEKKLHIAGTLTATDATFVSINNAFIGNTTAAAATFTALAVDTSTLYVEPNLDAVGIGTSRPISVSGTGVTVAGVYPQIVLEDTDLADAAEGRLIRMMNNEGTLEIFESGRNGVGTTGTSSLMTILTNNYVGIGDVTAPERMMHIPGSLTATDATFETINNAQIGATTPAEATFTMVHVGTTSIDYATTADSLYVAGDFEVDGDVWLGDTVTDSLTIAGSLTQNSPLVITSTVAPQLTVAYNGSNDLDVSVTSDGSVTMNATGAGADFSISDNVGIGIANPSQLFVVGGSSQFKVSSTGAVTAESSTGQPFFTGHQLGAGYSYGATGIIRAITDNATGSANTYFQGVTGATTNFSVRADGLGYFAGNVGIGALAPEHKLHVAGALTATDATFETINSTLIGGTTPKDATFTAVHVSTGNVGIGTTVPTFLAGSGLHISDSSQANLRLEDDGEFADIANSGGDFYIINRKATGDLKFRVNSATEAISIIEDGNVGIGTTVPTTLLHLQKTGADLTLTVQNYESNVQREPSIAFRGSSASGVGSNNAAIFVRDEGNAKSAFAFETRDGATQAERMRITNLGNVGIGDTEPAAELEVAGGLIAVDATFTNFALTGGLNATLIGNTTPADATFTAVHVTTGNVGIGTTTPGAKLEVFEGNLLIGDASDTGYGLSFERNSVVSGLINTANGILNIQAQNNKRIDLRDDAGAGMTIADGGNVGIGTTGPLEELYVYSSSPALVLADSDGGAADFAFEANANKLTIDFHGGNDLLTMGLTETVFNDNQQDYNFRIESDVADNALFVEGSSGNVGIGTTTPATILHSYEDSNDENAGYTIEQDGTGDSVAQFLLTGAQRLMMGLDNSDGDKFKIADGATLDSGTRLTIDSTGNVGISTTSPLQVLDVGSGNITTLGRVGIGADASATYPLSVASVDTAGLEIMNLGSGNKSWRLKPSGNDLLITETSVADRVTFQAGGNVGIGTTAPLDNLYIRESNATVYSPTDTVTPVGSNLVLQNISSTAGIGSFLTFRSSSPDSNTDGGYIGFISAATAFQGNMVFGRRLGGASFQESMRINYQGNIGIAVTDPAAELEVAGGLIAVDATFTNFALTGGLNATQIGNATPADATFTAVHVTTGNVGIGTTAPATNLDILGTNQQNLGIVNITDTTAFAQGVGGRLSLRGKYNTGGSLAIYGAVAGVKENVTDGSFLGGLALYSLGASGNIGERVRIDSNGNVGIGTTTPVESLDVLGAVMATAQGALASPGEGIVIDYIPASNTGRLQVGDWGTEYEPLDIQAETIRILSGTGGATQGFYQDTLGNVGIGVTDPDKTLEVAGNMSAIDATFTTMTVTAAATPTLSQAGQIAFDSTDGILIASDGTNNFLVADDLDSFTFTLGTKGNWKNDMWPIWQAPKDMAVTIIQIDIAVTGTSTPVLTYNFEERASGSLGVAGTDVYGADQTADANGETETVFANAELAASSHLCFATGATPESGTVDMLHGTVYYRPNIE